MASIFSLIYWTSAVVVIITFTALFINAYRIWKKRHPDHKGNRVELADALHTSALVCLAVLVPAINTCFAVYYVMNFTDITDSVLKSMEDKYYPM